MLALALPFQESGITAPATLVSELGCFPRALRNRQTQKCGKMSDLRAILPSTWVLAMLGPAVPGIRDSCSSYAGFRPRLLAVGPLPHGNAKTRVDRRSTHVFAF